LRPNRLSEKARLVAASELIQLCAEVSGRGRRSPTFHLAVCDPNDQLAWDVRWAEAEQSLEKISDSCGRSQRCVGHDRRVWLGEPACVALFD
jgi:hypothetical protein